MWIQFIKSIMQHIKDQQCDVPVSTMEKIEKELMAIYSDKDHPSRLLFFHRFQDYIYYCLVNNIQDSAEASFSSRFTLTITTCLLPLLDNISKKLKQILDLTLKLHYETYKAIVIKINQNALKNANEERIKALAAEAASQISRSPAAVHLDKKDKKIFFSR